jgi:hypothetical protein
MSTGPYMTAHPVVRRPTKEQLDIIVALHSSGAASRVILWGLQVADSDILMWHKDLYNLNAKFRWERLM